MQVESPFLPVPKKLFDPHAPLVKPHDFESGREICHESPWVVFSLSPVVHQIDRPKAARFCNLDTSDVPALPFLWIQPAAFSPRLCLAFSHAGICVKAYAVAPSLLFGRLQKVNRMELSVSDQNDLGLRRHQLGKLLQKVGLQLCPSGASLPLDPPQNGQGPTAICQRRDQQAPLTAQLQAVDQKAQRAALRRFLKKTPRDGTVAPAWIDILVVHKAAHPARFASLLGSAGKLVGHRRQMDMLRAVKTRDKPG
jgi:hypothetical protein